jgi:hypothetical protein
MFSYSIDTLHYHTSLIAHVINPLRREAIARRSPRRTASTRPTVHPGLKMGLIRKKEETEL